MYFLTGEGKEGNFEPSDKKTRKSGPGEGGKAHKLRVEQKQEEERLKGVYGFNQLVSDELSLNRTVPDTREETITEANLWGSVPTCVVCVKIDLSQAVGVSWSN